mmetsp:Transcript_3109/g.4271  ORF Transcript_3109/g.4271 Transcript_3109/m.4271 type:complete len:272 (-) Transcript_3109:1924-2739(-)
MAVVYSQSAFMSLSDQLDHLIQEIRSNPPSLRKLDLSNYQIGDDNGYRLGQALIQNTHIETLNLNSNRLGLRTAQALVDVIRVHPTLRVLSLNNNWLRDEGCVLLASSLTNSIRHPSQSKLEVLNLSNNHIGCMGAIAMATTLCNNNDNQLKQLSLDDNFCGAEGCQALAKSLSENSTLEQLTLKGNYGGHLSAKSFLQSLKTNCTIYRLSLDCSISCRRQLEYWLFFNRFGKRALASELASSLWPLVLEKSAGKAHLMHPLIEGRPEVLT